MLSLTDLQPVIDAVGSCDDSLLSAVLERYKQELTDYYDGDEPEADELEEFEEYAESMINCDPAPDAEPGAWNYVIQTLADHFDLNPEPLPLDDWKHFYVWEDYRNLLDPLISADARQLLALLENGRALKGTSIDGDGCVFAWLSPLEVVTLHDALSPIEVTEEMQKRGLDEFHRELLECLDATRKQNAVLFLAAH